MAAMHPDACTHNVHDEVIGTIAKFNFTNFFRFVWGQTAILKTVFPAILYETVVQEEY